MITFILFINLDLLYRTRWAYKESRKAMVDYYDYILYCHKNEILEDHIKEHYTNLFEYSEVYHRAIKGSSWDIKDYIKDKEFFEEIQEWRKKNVSSVD